MNFFSSNESKNVHRMQRENKTDTKVISQRPETERFGLGTCIIRDKDKNLF
jgi:hypothetical protein